MVKTKVMVTDTEARQRQLDLQHHRSVSLLCGKSRVAEPIKTLFTAEPRQCRAATASRFARRTGSSRKSGIVCLRYEKEVFVLASQEPPGLRWEWETKRRITALWACKAYWDVHPEVAGCSGGATESVLSVVLGCERMLTGVKVGCGRRHQLAGSRFDRIS